MPAAFPRDYPLLLFPWHSHLAAGGQTLKTNLASGLFRADSVAVSLGAAGAASGISRAIGLVRGIALAWIIPQAQFGLFGVAQLIANVLLPLCCMGLHEGVARYVPQHESAGTLRAFLRRVSMLIAGIATATTAFLFAFAGPVGVLLFSTPRPAEGVSAGFEPEADSAGLMRAMLLCVLALVIYQTVAGLLRGLRMFRALSVAEVLSAVSFTASAVGGALLGHTTAKALMGAYAIACVVPVLLVAPGLYSHVRSVEPAGGASPVRPRAGLMAYSGWLAATAVVWHALSYYPMWYLIKVSNSETVGLFHATRIVTQIVHIAAAVLTTVVAAHVTRIWEHDGRGASAARLSALTKAALLSLFVASALLSLARPIVLRVFPDKFAAGRLAYDPLVMFFLLVGIVGLLAVRFNLLEKPLRVFVAWLVGGAVNVVTSYLLLGSMGGSPVPASEALPLAAWASVAGALASLTLCILFLRGEMLHPDLQTILLTLVCLSTGLGWRGAMPIAGVVLLIAWKTDYLFTPADRAEMRLSFLAPHAR